MPGLVSKAGGFAVLAMCFSGCAVMPGQSSRNFETTVIAERDLLAEAVIAVDATPWPKPESISLLARVTGGGSDDKISKSDAVDQYVDALSREPAPFAQLASDAQSNLSAAKNLNSVARGALDAQRLSMNDVALLETAMKMLRDNRSMYADAAHDLAKLGATVDDGEVDALRDAFADAIKDLGKTADLLAKKIDEDRTSTYARPTSVSEPRRFEGSY